MEIADLIIIGAGPTGIACGIAAKENGLNFTILEKGVLVNSIYNFPSQMTFFSTSLKLEIGNIPFISHNDKPTRNEALEYYRRLALAYNLPIIYHQKVMDITNIDSVFHITSTKGNYMARNVILATGFYDCPKKLNIPGEELPKVKHYYDDAHLYIGQKVAIIGAANSACDVALETWSKGAEVTMIVRESELYQGVKYWILPNIENRIKEGSIKAYFDSNVTTIDENFIEVTTPNDKIVLENDYVLSMTGYKPDYDFLEKVKVDIKGDENRTPNINPETFESNISGLYLAGVVQSGMATSQLFIENTRHHGYQIITHIKNKQNLSQ